MTEIKRHPTLDGYYSRSNMIVKPPPVDIADETTNNEDKANSNNTTNRVTNSGSNTDKTAPKQTRQPRAARAKYYIDELGFYRHLDPEQRQYVCSNLNSVRSTARGGDSAGTATNMRHGNPMKTLLSGDGGYEICFHSIRNDLGISHFDRTVGYEEWKQSWDNFMRAKLTKQEPVTLNSELKARVRMGIPHDYRCKVWTALIRMRTKLMRSTHGEDIYEVLLRDYVRKVDIPEYRPDSDDQNHNNNGGAGGGGDTRSGLRPRRLTSTSSTARPALQEAAISTNRPQQQQPQVQVQVQPSPLQRPAIEPNIAEPFIEKCFKQIELDLLRTLPNNRHFEDPNSRGIRRVRNVLRAYACFNPTVGYCQGMNRLAAMALLVLPEEEAFWCLVAIIQCIMPKDYYLKPWLAQVDCCVLSDLLERKMPRLHKHLVKNDIQLTLFTWFFTIFVDGFRPELMLRIWDCFLLEGDKVLFRIALAILHISQDDLLRMHDFSTMSSHLSRLVSTRQLDMEQLFESK